MTDAAVVAVDLSKWFGEGTARTTAVNLARFEARFGEMLIPGQRKNPLLSIIAGILRPNGRSVTINAARSPIRETV